MDTRVKHEYDSKEKLSEYDEEKKLHEYGRKETKVMPRFREKTSRDLPIHIIIT